MEFVCSRAGGLRRRTRIPVRATLLAGAVQMVVFCVLTAVPLCAQTIDDGIMLEKNELFVGSTYMYDSWDHYWEGALKRDNGNIGTLTTQTNTWFANYGVTRRLNVIATVPYVWTRASKGVLHGMSGFQDITVVAKYRAFETPFTSHGSLKAIGVIAAGTPLTDYSPDFMPMSIGSRSGRLGSRFTGNYQGNNGLYINGTLAYTWRGPVTLDRPYYFTDGQLFLTDHVHMPAVFDYTTSAGYYKRRLMLEGFFMQQRTKGGGDIRRQDMPFVSNRMNYSKVGGMLMYPLPLPKLRDFCFQFAYARTIDGRNVGQSNTVTTGLMYLFHFGARASK